MSDMPGPLPTPSHDAPHASHDALLVAQLASGDVLDGSQRQEAERLVRSCPACAALAADLRAISRVVAWEPRSPRRKDFRLSPADAERLRGSAFSRFLRRLSLPQGDALRPTALGALSVGLLFVVAGTVWPNGGAGSPVGTPADVVTDLTASAAPAGMIDAAPVGEAPADAEADAAAESQADARGESQADAPREAQADAPAEVDSPALVPLVEDTRGDTSDEAPAPAPDALIEQAVPRAAQEASGEERATERAELSIESSQALSAAATEGAGFRDESDAFAPAGREETTEPDDGAEKGSAELQAVSPAVTVLPAVPSSAPSSAASPAPPVAASPASEAVLGASDDEVSGGSPDAKSTLGSDQLATPASDGLTIATVLLAAGIVLALGGVLLLLLRWVLRRSTDPLLR